MADIREMMATVRQIYAEGNRLRQEEHEVPNRDMVGADGACKSNHLRRDDIGLFNPDLDNSKEEEILPDGKLPIYVDVFAFTGRLFTLAT